MTASSELICFKTNFDPRGRAWLRFLLQPKPLVHAPTTSHKSSHCSCTQLTLHNTHRGSMPRLLGQKKKKKKHPKGSITYCGNKNDQNISVTACFRVRDSGFLPRRPFCSKDVRRRSSQEKKRAPVKRVGPAECSTLNPSGLASATVK